MSENPTNKPFAFRVLHRVELVRTIVVQASSVKEAQAKLVQELDLGQHGMGQIKEIQYPAGWDVDEMWSFFLSEIEEGEAS